MYVNESYEFENLLCLSGSTITGNYKIIGHIEVNELECLVLKNIGSHHLEVATIEELKRSKK
jgi:hypothetical protein